MTDRDFTRRMLKPVAALAGTAILLAVLWAAREALLLIYVSALIAMGFSPIVRMLERPRRIPRLLAILVIYAAIVGGIVLIGLLIIPPLVAQAASLWAQLPTHFNTFQS